MNTLPRYSKTPIANDEESEALVKGGRSSLDDAVDGLTSYPPPRAGPSGSGVHNVTYFFDPQYPVKGKAQRVLGVLGRNREETIEKVRRVFEEVNDYPDERIVFEAGFGEDKEWSRLMDEVWDQFSHNPPDRLRVTIKDAPGDQQKRNRRKCKHASILLGAVFGYFAVALTTVWYFGGFEDQKKNQ